MSQLAKKYSSEYPSEPGNLPDYSQPTQGDHNMSSDNPETS